MSTSTSTVETFLPLYALNRQRTLGVLDKIEQLPNPDEVLLWRPAPGRAHIGWQLMHVAMTEELFATERLLGTTPGFGDLVLRFKFGSTPDDNLPSRAEIRQALAESRQHLEATLRQFGDERLDYIAPALAQRQMTVLGVLHILAWHEAHHQGQAHITLNMYLNRPAQ